MYLDLNTKCPTSALFDVPHQITPMRCKEIQTKFPEFAKLFDGEAKENTLLFYWEWNEREKVFEFIDENAEDKVAELMGVTLLDQEEGEESGFKK